MPEMFNLYEEMLPYGEPYDFLADNAAEDALELAFHFTESLRTPKNSEGELRQGLSRALSDVVGYRLAENIAHETPEIICEALTEEARRRARARADLELLIERAAEKVAKEYPPDFGNREVRRDSYFYIATRSGLLRVYEALTGESISPDAFADQMLSGARLKALIKDSQAFSIVDILPSAVFYERARSRIDRALKERGVSDGERRALITSIPYARSIDEAAASLVPTLGHAPDEVYDTLANCFLANRKFEEAFADFRRKLNVHEDCAMEIKTILQRAVKGSGTSFWVARGLHDLERNAPAEYVVRGSYRTPRMYALADKVNSQLGLRRYPVDVVHTRQANRANTLIHWYRSGKAAIPRALLRSLFEETGLDLRPAITAWTFPHSKKLFYPKARLPVADLGTIYGTFALGHGSIGGGRRGWVKARFSLTRKNASDLDSLVHLVGALPDRMKTRNAPRSGKLRRPGTYIDFPHHIYRIVEMLDHNLARLSESPEFRRAALKAWLEERGFVDNDRHYLCGFVDTVPRTGCGDSQENAVRTLALKAGLRLSQGSRPKGRMAKLIYVQNPDAIGACSSDFMKYKDRG